MPVQQVQEIQDLHLTRLAAALSHDCNRGRAAPEGPPSTQETHELYVRLYIKWLATNCISSNTLLDSCVLETC